MWKRKDGPGPGGKGNEEMGEPIQRLKEEPGRGFSREELVNFLDDQGPEKISRLILSAFIRGGPIL
jgi:hypothetical protein